MSAQTPLTAVTVGVNLDGTVVSSSSSTFGQGTAFISGSTVVSALTEPIEIYLQNISGDEIAYVDGPSQASFLITQSGSQTSIG
jgi:hypothetical protein